MFEATIKSAEITLDKEEDDELGDKDVDII